MYKLIVSYLVEFLGTFVLVLTILSNQDNVLLESILSGIVLALLIYYSKTYFKVFKSPTFNPAVTISHLLKGNLNLYQYLIYTLLELSGGITAFYFLNYITKFMFN